MGLDPDMLKAVGGGAIAGALFLAVTLESAGRPGQRIEGANAGVIASAAMTAARPSASPADRFELVVSAPSGLSGSDTSTAALAERTATFGDVQAPNPVLVLADWVARSGDNLDHDFIIVDKQGAHLYLFDASANLRSSTPVLIGAAVGDHSVADIGTRPIAAIQPEERTTPAGRFVAEPGHNADDEPVIWIDYDVAVSMHAVRSAPRQRRLDTPGIDDNRISYGCINVPKPFFNEQVRPVFTNRTAIVYVLPDVRSLIAVFPGIAQGNQLSRARH